MVPQGGGSRTHTQTHTCTHVQYTYRQLVWSLFVPRSSRVRCIYIHTHTHTIHVPTRIYKTINFSLSLLPSVYLSIFHRLSFKHLFPRPVSEAGLHGRHSRLGRDPSTIDSETRYRNLGAQHRASPPAKPRENPRLIAISPLRALPFRVDLVAGYGRRGGVADDFRFREPSV